MDDNFIAYFLNFAGRRIETATRINPIIIEHDGPHSYLNEEELHNTKESIARAALYIVGLIGGLRLAALFAGKKDTHV